MRVADPAPPESTGSTGPAGPADTTVATWSRADLERRVLRALDFAEVAVRDFGTSGYDDPQRPALGFGPDKLIAEAAMLAYVAAGAGADGPVRTRAGELADRLVPYVRSRAALADLARRPDRVFRRAVPHVLLSTLGNRVDPSFEAFDDFAADRCARVLAGAVDEPATVHAERQWITRVWARPFPTGPAGAGTLLDRPFDLALESRENAYGVTHLLFYVTDFGRAPGVPTRRPRAAILADVEALVLRYLDHDDYDLTAELLMAWPQLGEPWSPAAALAFRLLAEVEDETGVLPCGNLDPARLLALQGAERTRYARATSYHTAFVMGFLCAAALRSGPPPTTIVGPAHPGEAWSVFRGMVADHRAHWPVALDACAAHERSALVPMLCGLVITQALRRNDFRTLHDAVTAARRFELPAQPLAGTATDLLRAARTGLDLDPG